MGCGTVAGCLMDTIQDGKTKTVGANRFNEDISAREFEKAINASL
jgi:hypothetical protein